MKYLEDMTVQELKDYILGLIAIPFEKYTTDDSQNLAEARIVLQRLGWETSIPNDWDVTFKRVAKGGHHEYT